jgi:hypothetical protein
VAYYRVKELLCFFKVLRVLLNLGYPWEVEDGGRSGLDKSCGYRIS